MKTRHIMCAAAACCLLFLGYLGWQFVSDIEIGDVPDPSAGPFVAMRQLRRHVDAYFDLRAHRRFAPGV